MNTDPLGQAVHEYLHSRKTAYITVESDVVEHDKIPVTYLYREYNDMPIQEQIALEKCTGNVLDIGAGAGTHSLYLQQQGMQVTALEVSGLACQVMQQRGITNVVHSDIMNYNNSNFDTLLLLMNGIGLAGTLQQLPAFLQHCLTLLKPGGKIIFDSSDLVYLYSLDQLNETTRYYGEVHYRMRYKNHCTAWFNWLYIAFSKLKEVCTTMQLKTKLLYKGKHYEYLVSVSK